METKELIILKMGGSVITNKQEKFSAHHDVIDKICFEISKIKKSLILIYGAGSFGHPLAKKFEIHKGFHSKSQLKGILDIRVKMQDLGNIISNALQRYNVDVMPIVSSSCMVAQNKRLIHVDIEVFQLFLRLGMVPMCSGDVVADKKLGFCIVSGDQMAVYLAKKLNANKVIFGCDVDGIFSSNPKQNEDAKLLTKIKLADLDNILKNSISETDSPDVTGGMLGKLKEGIKLVNLGIEVNIMNLNKPENLSKLINEEEVRCTQLIP